MKNDDKTEAAVDDETTQAIIIYFVLVKLISLAIAIIFS